jgi:hypothetical protein
MTLVTMQDINLEAFRILIEGSLQNRAREIGEGVNNTSNNSTSKTAKGIRSNRTIKNNMEGKPLGFRSSIPCIIQADARNRK